MKLVELRKRMRCPKRTIIVVVDGDTDASYSWHYGPNTVNKWPLGDYYDNGTYIEPASSDYHSMQEESDYYKEFQVHPAHLVVDIGL